MTRDLTVRKLFAGVLPTTRGVRNTVDTVGSEHESVVAGDSAEVVTTNRGAVRRAVALTLGIGGTAVSISGALVSFSVEAIVAACMMD